MHVIRMRKILITGASGILGQKLAKKSSELFDVLALSKKDLNIIDQNNVYTIFKEFQPDIVVNCAAFTNVDKAEDKKSLARDVNVKGLSNIIKSLSPSSKIIHISSDYVFDGLSGDYLESDIKSPLNYYGKTKLEADNLLMGSNCHYLIIRPNVLYSDSGIGSNEAPQHFLSWLINKLSNGDSINVVNDQISNPTYISDLVNVIITSILVDYVGVCHYGSEDILSRYEFAMKVCDVFGFSPNKIIPIPSSDLNQVANRPKKTYLNCEKVVKDLNIELYPTEYSLNRVKSIL